MERKIASAGTYKGYKFVIVQFDNNDDLFWFQEVAPLRYYCGYVLVPQWHSAFEVEYDDLDICAHGGLTYSKHTLLGQKYPGWWIGFDCAHVEDVSNPKDLQFCINQCYGIIDQLEEMEK